MEKEKLNDEEKECDCCCDCCDDECDCCEEECDCCSEECNCSSDCKCGCNEEE